jgi:hypothetical protein
VTGRQLQALFDTYRLRHTDVADLLDVGVRTVERYVAAPRVPRVVEYALRYAILQKGLKPL